MSAPTPLIRLVRLADFLPSAFNDRYQNAGTWHACVACGKRTSDKGASLGVWIGREGGSYIIHPEDSDAEYAADPGSFLGWFPVGSECIKRVPAEFHAPNPYEDKVRGV